MAFTNPIALPSHGTQPALTLTRVSTGPNSSQFLDLANGTSLTIEHSKPSDLGVKSERHYLRYSQAKDVTLPSGAVVKQTASVSVAVSIPPHGWTTAEKQDLYYSAVVLMSDADFLPADLIGFAI